MKQEVEDDNRDAGRPLRDARYWRTLAESYGAEPNLGEFPIGADMQPGQWSRRHFLGLVGASMALAGLGGCTPSPDDNLVPYVQQPLGAHIGRASHYATTMTLHGYGTGLIVTAQEGRPTKIEGNPDHPASLGSAGVFEQASLLQLYDPDRARSPRYHDQPCVWDDGVRDLADRIGATGARLRILIEPTSSWCLVNQLDVLCRRWPEVRVMVHDSSPEALDQPSARALEALFGRSLVVRTDMARAQVIVSIDADPLAAGTWHLANARSFSTHRRLRIPGQEMNRLYVAESSPTCTGSIADHRLRINDRDLTDLMVGLMRELAHTHGVTFPDDRLLDLSPGLLSDKQTDWIRAAAADLARNRGASLLLVGARQPALLHALGHLINDVLGNVGATITYAPSLRYEGHGCLVDLATDLESGKVDEVLILGGNPMACAPGDIPLRRLLARARHRCYLGLYEDETAEACERFIPQAHYLESWGDARALDGTASLQQPLISPLHGGMTPIAVLAAVLGQLGTDRALLRSAWQPYLADKPEDFDSKWQMALRRGFLPGSAVSAIQVVADWSAVFRLPRPPRRHTVYDVSLRLDGKVHDGRFANNPWLQELPDPISTLTWDNAALFSPSAARALGVVQGDVVTIRGRQGDITIPVLVQPGQADETITISLGYGRKGAESTARGIGADAYGLRSGIEPWLVAIETIVKQPSSHALATTQQHWSMEGRPIIHEMSLADFMADPHRLGVTPARPSLRPAPPEQKGPQWGMVIDLSVCIGCNACVLACQAENNIPVVGKDNVLRSREMHWLRVDRYYRGDVDDPVPLMQPMACQHCEKAPCEYVCPTYATTHSTDGLNEMTYNRCVGTRFCSNNCPYKVRRFNWYNFNDGRDPMIRMSYNPNVTVRARGVMEKCTYCVQRIRVAEHRARIDGVELVTDQVVSACQQTCPTQAIIFGDISDPKSVVSAARRHPLAYSVLEDTGAQPRTQYLARLNNPHLGLP